MFQFESLETRCLLSAAYTITDLGALPSGNGMSYATGINASGQVVGYSNVATDGTNHPFLYSNGAMRDLNPGGGDSQATGINDAGQVVGKNGDAFLYSGGVMQSIGNLPGGNTSFAYAINNSGQIAGDSLTSDPSITHAFLWSNGQMQDLGTLGGSQSNAFGINNLGQVVGLAYASDGVAHAFLWSNGQMQDLGALWGRAASFAKGINDSGEVVGYGYFWGLQPRHAFVYANGKMTDLQTLGGESSAALAVNNVGQIVGDSNDAAGDDHAFVYSNGQMQDLNSLVNPGSGWMLQVATAINSAGQIAGTGVINGRQHAFLLTPAPVTNPPPPRSDTTPPTASVSAPAVTAVGASTESVTVTYSDNVAIDAATIGKGNITVAGPGGALQVTGVQVSSSGNSATVTATYTVAAPNGSWQPGNNGTYTVTVVPSTVKDTSGNGVTTATGSFSVNVTPVDSTPPSAQISAPNITAAGATTETVTVVYTDNIAVNAASINAGNISVTGPAGALNVTAAHANGGSGSPLVVTYTVAAPHGAWSSSDNGSYIVALKANQVSDTNGNFATGASGSFTVNVPAPVSSGPDQSFNNGQPVGTNFVSESILTQADGKVIAVGRFGDLSAGTSQGVIERLNSDGSLDQSFGANGTVTTSAGANDAYFAAVMQDVSHLIVAGTSGGNFVLRRYDLSGKIDPTFGVQGTVTTDFGGTDDTVRGIAIAPGGMIVVGGDSSGNFAFARYTAAGNLDTNFAQGGQQLFGLGAGSANGMGGIIVQSDARIVAVGAEGASVVAVRLTSAGEADGTFGTGGLVTVPGLVARTDLGTPDRSEGMALNSAGQLLIANRTSSGHFGLVRLNSNGTTDTGFGASGLVSADFGGDDDADSIVLQSSGPIVLVGTSNQGGSAQTAVAAFDANGTPVSGFGTGGLLLLPNTITSSTMKAAAVSGVMRPSALHVGNIVLRAFATVTSDGRVIVGTTNEAVAATTSSTLRRLLVPGAQVGATDGLGTPVDTFGVVNGKIKKLTVTDQDGTKVTFILKGGTGTLYQNGNRYNLVINDLGKGMVLTITGRGGDGRVSIGDIKASGTLRTLIARNSDIYGTLHVTGAIGSLNLGNVSGTVWSGASIANITATDLLSGNVFATGALGKLTFRNVSGTIASGSGAIGTVTAAALNNARILSGANLGDDGAVGGTGTDQDQFGAGAISSIKVAGAITSSFIGAGVDPVDTTFGNNNDRVIGSTSSAIRSLRARTADQSSTFEAGAFGKVMLPKKINVSQDARFKVL